MILDATNSFRDGQDFGLRRQSKAATALWILFRDGAAAPPHTAVRLCLTARLKSIPSGLRLGYLEAEPPWY